MSLDKWANRTQNKRSGTCDYADQGNIIITDKVVYSYGHHHPLAVYAGKDNQDVNVYYHNGDNWGRSKSTPMHRHRVYKAIKSAPNTKVVTISFSAVGQYVNPLELTPDNLKDATSIANSPMLFKSNKDGKIYELQLLAEALEGEECNSWLNARYPSDSSKYSREHEYAKPLQGAYFPSKVWTEGVGEDARSYSIGGWHTAEAVLLEVNRITTTYENTSGAYETVTRNRFMKLLCAVDEGKYFVAELPYLERRRIEKVQDAFDSLKPIQVIQAEQEGLAVQRQGEWFFIPCALDTDTSEDVEFAHATLEDLAEEYGFSKAELKRRCVRKFLPNNGAGSNLHELTIVKVPNYDSDANGITMNIIVTGKVYHRRPSGGGMSGEHKTLDLGRQLYRVMKNTEISSFSSGGNVD